RGGRVRPTIPARVVVPKCPPRASPPPPLERRGPNAIMTRRAVVPDSAAPGGAPVPAGRRMCPRHGSPAGTFRGGRPARRRIRALRGTARSHGRVRAGDPPARTGRRRRRFRGARGAHPHRGTGPAGAYRRPPARAAVRRRPPRHARLTPVPLGPSLPPRLVVLDVDGTLHDAFGWWPRVLRRGLAAFAAERGFAVELPDDGAACAVIGKRDAEVWSPFLPPEHRALWPELRAAVVPLECEELRGGIDWLYPGM